MRRQVVRAGATFIAALLLVLLDSCSNLQWARVVAASAPSRVSKTLTLQLSVCLPGSSTPPIEVRETAIDVHLKVPLRVDMNGDRKLCGGTAAVVTLSQPIDSRRVFDDHYPGEAVTVAINLAGSPPTNGS